MNRADARELPIQPDRPDGSGARELVVIDVVELHSARIDIAEDHVVAETHDLPTAPVLTGLRGLDQTDAAFLNAESNRVMTPASFTSEQDLHFVLCDFGRSGQAYVETDPTHADASTIVRNLLDAQYNRPVRILALNVEEGWVRDVSQVIAAKVRDVARRDGQALTDGTRDFIEAHSDPADQQQVLPLWQ
jgi:hypothetical protein